MNTHTGGVTVVAANLAQTDRRALSQAQYSALHVAEHHASRPGARSPKAAASDFAKAVAVHTSPRAKTSGAAASSARDRNVSGDLKTPPFERRMPKTELARRIVRAVEKHPLRQNASASVALKTPDGRVQLLVRSDGGVTRVVALCAAPLKDRVERALAQARFALAAGGVRIGTCA